MARVKLTEFISKSLLQDCFNYSYQGISLTLDSYQTKLKQYQQYPAVLKVDQAIKQRGKQGLVALNLTSNQQIIHQLQIWFKQGYSNFLLEPLISHSQTQEHYLALERVRFGWQLTYADIGGVEIESHWDQTTQLTLASDKNLPNTLPAHLLKLLPSLFSKLDLYHLSFLEINPYILNNNQVIPLDMAVEIDSAGLPFTKLHTQLPLQPIESSQTSSIEAKIAQLNQATPASLKFNLLNPQGRIWMLLSGGGASLVLADEVADLGLGNELANYGEYSGDPKPDDTYRYTKLILQQLLKVKITSPKALIIAGGVANFTDIARTFSGIIRALDEVKAQLVKHQLKVFVRRGGPNQAIGLQQMRDFLQSANLLGCVYDHTSPLTKLVQDVKNYL